MALTKKFDYNIDLDFNALKNALLNPMTLSEKNSLSLTVDEEGYICYVTDDDNLYFWTGTQWGTFGTTLLTQLLDFPHSYTGQSNKILRVKSTEDGVEFHILTKGDVGLGNVDNTSDSEKPVSTAQQTALNLKADITSVPTHTHQLTNDGSDSVHPYISLNDIPPQVYQNDIVVSGTTLGRYGDRDTIPSAGKTPEEVTVLLAHKPINPTVNLSSATSILFNQTSISNVLAFSYIILGLGATVATAVLEWRRNNTGAWTTLSSSTSITTFTHSLTDSAFNTQPFNYRYTVTDTQGAAGVHTFDITPQAYVAPSITFSAPATALALGIESNQLREIGNTSSVLQGSTTRNSSLVPISAYQFSISVNGGGFSNVGSNVSLSSSGGSFTNLTDATATSSATTITYKVTVTDSFTTTSATYSINLYYVIFYGPVSAASSNSAQVRANSSYQFINGSNPFILNTGTIDKIFEIALPNPHGISQILDLDALSANITGSFAETDFNVNDGGGTATAYRIFDMTNAVPYGSNHRFQSTFI